MLRRAGCEIKLAKVDATVETMLAQRFELKGYPILKFFRGGQEREYSGPRDARVFTKSDS